MNDISGQVGVAGGPTGTSHPPPGRSDLARAGVARPVAVAVARGTTDASVLEVRAALADGLGGRRQADRLEPRLVRRLLPLEGVQGGLVDGAGEPQLLCLPVRKGGGEHPRNNLNYTSWEK